MHTVKVNSIIDPSKYYEYIDNGNPKQGGVKDVYFSPDRKYVVAFFRKPLDFNQKDRIKRIVTLYLENIKKGNAADYYLQDIYRWPYDAVEREGKTGVIVPIYNPHFFFSKGYGSSDNIKGGEKIGKWFTAASFRNKQYPLSLDKSELGNWLSYFQIAISICRGVKKMHQMGLAHSDLSYNNVLIDPVTKSANIIDLDGLVVPGLFPPEVIGTADFIAPEVLKTKHLSLKDPGRILPNQQTDLHALSILIYMYLLRRHPLRGSKIWDQDAEKDELMAMGEKALFVENPANKTNRVKADQLRKWDTFWGNPDKIPYTITGPYLTELFKRAFIDGLHNPMLRPIANEWETALLKTVDLIQPCSNTTCDEKWYVFDNTAKPTCPFCGTAHKGTLPVVDLYYKFKNDIWKPEGHRLMVYHNQYLFKWHVSKKIIRNESLTAEDKKPVGYFAIYHKKWVLVNQSLDGMKDLTENKDIPRNAMVELISGKKILLSNEEGGRLLYITITNQ
ncbi:Protein kinase domain-containing protein [Filimonas lacunae]|uniref:Protein kinase domain-containing protein n=1 Tax=Filimonas lacunae TaxID=477680 RepID=A0A173MEE7_9BACT|nr:kinase [Filimonas lacunae]BAV05945.1 kinase domain protein [Filimonas lacunae]SIT23852.1 Protein kinase domain-containing protein [Filimonas lacunae]